MTQPRITKEAADQVEALWDQEAEGLLRYATVLTNSDAEGETWSAAPLRRPSWTGPRSAHAILAPSGRGYAGCARTCGSMASGAPRISTGFGPNLPSAINVLSSTLRM